MFVGLCARCACVRAHELGSGCEIKLEAKEPSKIDRHTFLKCVCMSVHVNICVFACTCVYVRARTCRSGCEIELGDVNGLSKIKNIFHKGVCVYAHVCACTHVCICERPRMRASTPARPHLHVLSRESECSARNSHISDIYMHMCINMYKYLCKCSSSFGGPPASLLLLLVVVLPVSQLQDQMSTIYQDGQDRMSHELHNVQTQVSNMQKNLDSMTRLLSEVTQYL